MSSQDQKNYEACAIYSQAVVDRDNETLCRIKNSIPNFFDVYIDYLKSIHNSMKKYTKASRKNPSELNYGIGNVNHIPNNFDLSPTIYKSNHNIYM